jgi:hypothetical protein
VTPAATDDHGRPIVAELGRAETPQETADRKAAASAKRRGNQTTVNLVIAIVASLGIVLFLILVVVRPNVPTVSEDNSIDYAAVAAEAQRAVDEELIVPVLPSGWWANRAEFNDSATDDVTTWRIGLITPSVQYIGFTQGLDANPSWVAGELENAQPTGTETIDGISWDVYDRRDAEDPGNLAYSLVTTVGNSTFVLSGTANDPEFATLAASVTAELES